MTAPFICRTITGPAELLALEPQWWDLWRQSPTATPFQSPAWLLHWWKHFAPADACVVAVEFDKRLVGLAPFYGEQDGHGRCIRLMGFPVTDYQDFVIAPTLEEPTLAALQSHLTNAGFWDALELAELPPDAHALRMIAPDHSEESSAWASACPVLGLPDAIEALERTFPARRRRALRMSRNRAERRGRVRILSNDHFILGNFETLVELHEHRWMSRGEPGVLADRRVRQFHRDAIQALMKAGLLRFYLLQIDGHAAAAYYGFCHRNQAYGYITGFDPVFAFESPGVILLGHAIAEATREGMHRFHFLRGQEPYKYQWGARDCWNKYRVFRRNSNSHERG